MKSCFFLILILITISINSQEIVEFRGIGRTGYYHETGLLKEWPVSGPELVLKIDDISKGYSQPIVAENKIFITGIKSGENDFISAYDLNGQLIWETAYGNSWTRSYPDSRCTPTYENGKMYIASGTGQLSCINAANGEKLWHIDVVEKYGGEIHTHGDAESPLVVNDVVVYHYWW
jgi:outer membrane protein assembly factor BamB